MNRFLTGLGKVLLFAGMPLMYGCINVEYVGQSFPALPENEPIQVYSPVAPMPAGDYRIIGRATIQAPDGTTRGDVHEALSELAREHGAEAVNILDYKRVRIGTYTPDTDRVQRVGWNRDGRNAGGAYIYSNYFGEVSSLEGRRSEVTELHIKAVLLVNSKKFQEIMKQHKNSQAKSKNTAVPEAVAGKNLSADEALEKSVKKIDIAPTKAPAVR